MDILEIIPYCLIYNIYQSNTLFWDINFRLRIYRSWVCCTVYCYESVLVIFVQNLIKLVFICIIIIVKVLNVCQTSDKNKNLLRQKILSHEGMQNLILYFSILPSGRLVKIYITIHFRVTWKINTYCYYTYGSFFGRCVMLWVLAFLVMSSSSLI